jgi:hypothetical protein
MLFEPHLRIASAAQRALAQIQQTLQKLVESIDKQEQSTESYRQQRIQVGLNAEVRLPIEIPEYYRSEQSERAEKNKRERSRLRLERFGVILAAIVAVLTGITLRVFYKQLKESQTQTGIFRDQANQAKLDAADQLRVAKDQLREGQKPIIWPSELGGPVYLSSYGQVVWTIHHMNYGRGPAINVTAIPWISIGGKEFQADYRHKTGGKIIGTVEPPNQPGDFSTAISPPGITQAEFDAAMKSPDKNISVKMVFHYGDTFGGKYETSVCLLHLNTGVISYCSGSYVK